MLDIADLDGDIEIEVKTGRTYVTVGAPDNDDLRVLSSAEVVGALQDITVKVRNIKQGFQVIRCEFALVGYDNLVFCGGHYFLFFFFFFARSLLTGC